MKPSACRSTSVPGEAVSTWAHRRSKSQFSVIEWRRWATRFATEATSQPPFLRPRPGANGTRSTSAKSATSIVRSTKGGLSYRETHILLDLVAESGKMLSHDLVEVSPILDIQNTTAQLALSGLGQTILIEFGIFGGLVRRSITSRPGLNIITWGKSCT